MHELNTRVSPYSENIQLQKLVALQHNDDAFWYLNDQSMLRTEK